MRTRTDRKTSGAALRLAAYILMTFALFLLPLTASAHSTVPSLSIPTIHVSTGFASRYRDSNWVPVQVSLQNSGTDFTGFVSLNIPAPSSNSFKPSSTSMYQQAINLPAGSQKQVTLYVPISTGNPGSTHAITVNLLDANEQKVTSETTSLRSIGSSDIFIGILSDQSTGFGPLSNVPLADPTASIIVETLRAASMPTMTEVLKNFDLIILDSFNTASLSQEQLTTLQNWVNEGGSLIVVGGPNWRRTLSPLPASLLPVSVTGTETLPAKTPLIPIGGPTQSGPNSNTLSNTLPTSVIASTATPSPHSTVALSAGTTPLLAQVQRGQGLICYLAFDPTLNPVLAWPNASALWQGLLLRMLGDQILTSGPSIGLAGSQGFPSSTDSGGFSGLLQSSLPNMLPPTDLILIILLGYVAMLGPARLLLVRLLKRRDWSWRITLCTIMIFSALSYTLALQQKGTSIVSSSISIMQLGQTNAGGTSARVTTYVGVYVPNQGNFQVNIPGSNLVQTFTESSSAQGNPATITSAAKETNVQLQGVNIWSLRTLVAKHDRHLKGGITSHLTLQSNNTLLGTVTNNLPYALSNVYLMMSSYFQSLGSMAAGEQKLVSLRLENPSQAPTFQSTTLADQITTSNNLQVPYLTYYNNSQHLSPLERHIAQLATLSGENSYSYCTNPPCFQNTQPFSTSRGILMNSSATLTSSNGPLTQVDDRDPLLIPGAAATLIGWADHSSDVADTITIKGSRVAGTQEAFLQAPLDVSFADQLNQTVNLPPDMVVGQLTDVQSQSAQTQSPGIYTLNAGSMTFEFALPTNVKLQNGNMKFVDSSTLTPAGMGNGSTTIDVNHMQIFLYSWQKHTWDRFNFSQDSLLVNNAQSYIDSNGRIVMQFANQKALQGTAIFSKPSLQVTGLLAN